MVFRFHFEYRKPNPMFLFVEYLQQIKGSKCPSLTCLVYNPVAGGGGHEGFPMSTVTKINEAKVLFVKQARAAMSGGLVNELLNDIKALLSSHEEDSQVIPESSTFESGWDAVNYHVKSTKGGDIMILKMRLAKADNKFPETQEVGPRSLKLKNIYNFPPKPKNIFSITLVKQYGYQ